ncbi:LacI family DNA-binding transcriptional regulator [Piscicoccus intestinalis]|uniref:LacI family DNA-binding transcriptional regulator n=1 Tax=Piscicoccus intestinalis TaxID=746033 RepID=UPI000837FFC2|nr:LacI family DNA-binding transcriptional regulator [Piscicoccus intestinalis]
MGNVNRRPGMADVARLAGVSHQTVSRYLNNPQIVSPATQERISQAIEQIGYRRDLGARALVTRRSGLIGVIVAEGGYFGPGQTSSSIQTAARERGYATLVAAIRDTSEAEVAQVVDQLLDHAVEGVAVIAPQKELVPQLLPLTGKVPQVLIADGVADQPGVHTVSVDQYAGAGMATEHLIALGHRRIAHLRGPITWFDAAERERGWAAAMEAAGLALLPPLSGDWSPESGFDAGVRLTCSELPDAVVVSNDLMAMGLLAAFREAGVRVPEDVSIVGYDDISGAAYFQPALTTVRQPFLELGEACVATLLDLIAGQDVSPTRVKPTLVVRRSTAESSPGRR